MSEKNTQETSVPESEEKKFCGIIMPIATMGDYDATHWIRVKSVLESAIQTAGYEPRIVSDGDAIAVLHGNIVQNLYDDEIVVCDVSGKNPNVMFELGMRLAFDKPTIVVKDDDTGYSFDTSPIKHIPYRRDQRYDDVERFRCDVTKAIKATIEAKNQDQKYSPFLKYFHHLTAKKLETEEVSQGDYILRKLDSVEKAIARLSVVNAKSLSGVGRASSPNDWQGIVYMPVADLQKMGIHKNEIDEFNNILSFIKRNDENNWTKFDIKSIEEGGVSVKRRDELVEIATKLPGNYREIRIL